VEDDHESVGCSIRDHDQRHCGVTEVRRAALVWSKSGVPWWEDQKMLRIRTQITCLLFAVICVSSAMAQTSGAPTVTLDGVVRDASGAVIRGAAVNVESGAFHAEARTDERGRFVFVEVPWGAGTIDVSEEGFVVAHKTWRSVEVGAAVHLEIVLEASPVKQQVVVSAARTEVRLTDTPGSTILLSSKDLAAAPAVRMDDVLREVPGFSLFRRSGSRTANASSQGVSLRGLGGTAASRALVLADGISLIDPFGGWVYWDRIPRAAVSTLEVVRGGTSNLYGSDALGGVVQILMKQPEAPAFSLETSYGNERTPELSLWAGSRMGKWDYSAATEMFRTDGFILVPESLRGSVDTAANVEDATVIAQIGHELGANGRVFGRGNYFTEFRHNGTPIQTNDTQIGEGAGGLDKQFGNDSLSVRIYGDVEGYDQRNSAVASDRDSETLTDVQHVPEQVAGGGAQWTHVLGKSQTLIGGTDLNEVIGASEDQLFSGKNQSQTGSGRQRTLGWFGEDIFHRPKWTVILAARVDDWSNFAGRIVTVPVSGTPAITVYPDRSDVALSPRLSLLRRLNQHVSVTGSVYRAFRAPTLNELYRTFRVGQIITYNNPLLNAERLTGAEAGVNVAGWDHKLDLRGTFFWSDIVDPIENVTIQNQAIPYTEQKENLGRTRSRGVELDGVLRVSGDVQVTVGYAYTQATVLSYPGNPGGIDLVGLDVPQVPRNVFTWEARYWNPWRLFASVQGRFVGRQFDDDLNTLPLNAFYTMNLELGRAVTRHLEIFAAAENLTDQRYEVARTPIVNVGPPILFRAGLRLNYPAEKR
jgi:outer membrane receptor protein involved in Fe transport